VAENAWNHGVVLGDRIDKSQFDLLWQTTGTAYVNGQPIGHGHSRDHGLDKYTFHVSVS